MEAVDIDKKWNARDLARYEMEKADYNPSIAAQHLEELARENPEVWKALTEDVLHTACYECCSRVRLNDRRAAFKMEAPDHTESNQRLKRYVSSIFDFRLPESGVKLGDANKADLQQAVNYYTEQSKIYMARAEWLNALSLKVGHGSVRDKIKESEVVQLKKHYAAV